jgi:hypothetical protein
MWKRLSIADAGVTRDPLKWICTTADGRAPAN